MSIYSIKNFYFKYPLSNKEALRNINLEIKKGEFLLICGKSGCGKSTLLRHLKTVLTPHGEKSGEIRFNSKLLQEVDDREQVSKIGYVLQNPDNQIVTDKVWHELAFGLESLGYDSDTIRLRVSEMASFFGIQSWFMKSVTDLSGGQKQLLNLASIMVMHPEVLILDEPTSQLDPIASNEFLQILKKINEDLGITIIICEHNLEDVYKMADKVVVMDKGEIIINDNPRNVGRKLKELEHDMFLSMPTAMKIAANISCLAHIPITVKEGREWIGDIFKDENIYHKIINPKIKDNKNKDTVISVKNAYFRYERNLPDTIKDLSLDIKEGEFYCILGGNGTGKTTTLSLLSGINKAHRGKVEIFNKDIRKYSNKELFNKNIVLLPQNPQSLFVKKSVELDLYEMLSKSKLSKVEKKEKINNISKLVEIEDLLNMHPYDLSGGEQQRAALAKVLLLDPKILLLDEPTKGLDISFKDKFAKIIQKLQKENITVVMVSHDIEFCAKYADECALFFNGNIITKNRPDRFFSGNSFYTTIANRISRDYFENAITCEDVIELCNMNFMKKAN